MDEEGDPMDDEDDDDPSFGEKKKKKKVPKVKTEKSPRIGGPVKLKKRECDRSYKRGRAKRRDR